MVLASDFLKVIGLMFFSCVESKAKIGKTLFIRNIIGISCRKTSLDKFIFLNTIVVFSAFTYHAFTYLFTFIHELGQAIVAVATGSEVLRFVVNLNGSGLVINSFVSYEMNLLVNVAGSLFRVVILTIFLRGTFRMKKFERSIFW